jgi:hypothetical protein
MAHAGRRSVGTQLIQSAMRRRSLDGIRNCPAPARRTATGSAAAGTYRRRGRALASAYR